MLGQASGPPIALDREDLDLEDDIGQLYDHQRQDPRALILREKVDEKRQLLMEGMSISLIVFLVAHSVVVPVLPPPNEHPLNSVFLPLCLLDFVAPLKVKGQGNAKNPLHKFLKKAKGIPSLNLELSWVYVHSTVS
jgi:hypothetical protein